MLPDTIGMPFPSPPRPFLCAFPNRDLNDWSDETRNGREDAISPLYGEKWVTVMVGVAASVTSPHRGWSAMRSCIAHKGVR